MVKIDDGKLILAAQLGDIELLEAKATSIPDPAAELNERRHQLAEIGSNNGKLTRRQVATEQLGRLGKEVAQAQAEHARLDKILAKLRDLRAHLLDGVNLGVPGLEVGDGELRLNGVSFRQASTAEGLKVACAIAAIQRPKLRLLRVDRAECLDADSKRTLLEIADAQGFQVVMTCVADGEQLKVEIVEGEK